MISIVTPVYNEEGNVVYFHDEVTRVMKDLAMDYEIIYVMMAPGTEPTSSFTNWPAATPMCGPSPLPGTSATRSPLPAAWTLPEGTR